MILYHTVKQISKKVTSYIIAMHEIDCLSVSLKVHIYQLKKATDINEWSALVKRVPNLQHSG